MRQKLPLPRPAGRALDLAPAGTAALLVPLVWSTLTIWALPRWPLSLAQAGLLVLGSALSLWLAVRPEWPIPAYPVIAVAAAAVWALALTASGRSVYRAQSWEAGVGWLTALAGTGAGFYLLAEQRRRVWFLRAFLWFGVAVAVVGLAQFYSASSNIFWLFPYRYSDCLGPFQNRNNFAAFVELLVPVALWQAFEARRDRIVYLAVAGFLVAAAVASGSRAGAAIVFLEVFAVFAVAWRQGKLPRGGLMRSAAWTFALAGLAILIAGWEVLWQRIQAGNLLLYRREIFASTVAMVAARPLSGFGPGTFQTVFPAYTTFDAGLVVNHAHNDWLEWAAEGGIPFALLLVSAAAWCIRPALRSIWGIGLLGVFLHACFDYPMQRLGVAGWVFVLIGALAADAAQPLMTPIGRRRATLRAKPALSTTSITSSTFL
jgi:O-antigen ligase